MDSCECVLSMCEEITKQLSPPRGSSLRNKFNPCQTFTFPKLRIPVVILCCRGRNASITLWLFYFLKCWEPRSDFNVIDCSDTPTVFTVDQVRSCPEGKWLISFLLSFFSGPAQVPMMSPNGSVPPIYVPPGYVSQVSVPPRFPVYRRRLSSSQSGAAVISDCWAPLCSLFIPLDHRREWSAAGPGATSAARLPPRRTLPSPSPAAASSCSPACLHPAPRHDAPAAALVHRHSRRCWRHELPIHFPVPSGSHLLRAGWV